MFILLSGPSSTGYTPSLNGNTSSDTPITNISQPQPMEVGTVPKSKISYFKSLAIYQLLLKCGSN